MLMDYQIEYLGIRGDTVMWFYTDGGDEPRMNLIVAKLDDPDNVATRCFDFGWNAVGDYHAQSRRCRRNSYNVMFPVGTRCLTF